MLKYSTALMLSFLIVANPAHAGSNGERAAVEALYRQVFKGKDLSVVPKLVAVDYIQHNPSVATGRNAFIAAFQRYFAAVPGLTVDVKRIISADDMVVVHSHWRNKPSDRGQAVIDIYRVKHGKIAEHWDVSQLVPESTANNNGVF